MPELKKLTTFKLRKAKNFRITQQHGSMAACDILKVREEMEVEEQEKRDTQLDQCVCATGDQCLAIGLKQCPYCKTVLKSQCSKAQCKVASGGKPTMIISNAATINSGKKEQVKNSSKEPPQK